MVDHCHRSLYQVWHSGQSDSSASEWWCWLWCLATYPPPSNCCGSLSWPGYPCLQGKRRLWQSPPMDEMGLRGTSVSPLRLSCCRVLYMFHMWRYAVSLPQTCLASRYIRVHASDMPLFRGGTSESLASYLREGSSVSRRNSLWRPAYLVRSGHRACWSKGVSVLEHLPCFQAILREYSLTTLAETSPSGSLLLFRLDAGQIWADNRPCWLIRCRLLLCLCKAGKPLTACRPRACSCLAHDAQWNRTGFLYQWENDFRSL